jgi:processive 1,2-diacylglycerol beta-glucosyltransferase
MRGSFRSKDQTPGNSFDGNFNFPGRTTVILLHDKETGAFIGTITEAHLQFLIDQLEEETHDDQDYYINETTINMFEEAGADAALVTLLRGALDKRTEMELRWSRS